MNIRQILIYLVLFRSDKHGIVDEFSGILLQGGVNLLFQSSYQSCSILVAKADVTKAQLILEQHGQATTVL